MKTVYQKRISKEESNLIARQIMMQVHHNLYQADEEIDHAVMYGQSVPEFLPYCDYNMNYIDEDYYSEVRIHTTSQSVVVEGYTTSGTLQSFIVSLDGTITVMQDGARSSSLGRVCWYIPESLQTHFASLEDWRLTQYETSCPDWAPISCFLPRDPSDHRPRFLSDII